MKKLKVTVLMLLLVTVLAACGKKAEITITDKGVTTTFEAKLPNTVEAILAEAQITLGAEDVTEPSLQTELSDAAPIKVLRMNTISVVIDDEEKTVKHLDGTVKDLLKDENITLNEAQSMNVKETDQLKDGMKLEIVTKYDVELTYDGKTEKAAAKYANVEELLKDYGITLGQDDVVTPELTAEVKPGLSVVVQRVTYKEEKKDEEIPFETERKDDSSITKGKEVTDTEGENGVKTVTWKVKMVDGKEESREQVSEEVTKEPVNEVILVGTKEKSTKPAGRYETERIAVPNCADGSHGYYEIHYSDGSVEYVEY